MKTKTIKNLKIVCLLLIFLQICTISSSVFAVDIGDSVSLYSVKTLDNIKMNYYGQDIVAYYTVYNKNGIEYPAYCVDYFHGGITDTKKYNVQITENYVDENYTDADINKIGVWKAIINGYPFKTYQELNCADEYEAYAATKQAVFCMLYDRDLKWYTYEGEEGERVYNAMTDIVKIARGSSQVPKSTTIDLSESEWQIDEINNEYLSKKINLNCETTISGFNVNLEGNVPTGTIITDLKNNKLTEFKNCKEFKVLIPLKNLINKDEFTINVQGKVNSYPMYFGQAPSTSVQSYVLTAGIVKQELSSKLIEYPENKTKVIIKKQDEEGNILQGVKFNILDYNKNIIFENIETNEDGIIEINNMIPGTYYLQETETLEGYEFSSQLIEFKIDLDEEKEITVENNKIPEEPEEPTEPEIPEEPEQPQEPDIPEEPIIPETPEIHEEQPPKLPRTGW